MFREMRRYKQELSEIECINILRDETYGTLAVLADEGYPYAVPLSYVYVEHKIYFHSAKVGHKIDAIQKHPKVSFCVVSKNEVKPEEYTTYFQSVIVFGSIRIIEDIKECKEALEQLCLKYNKDDSIHHRTEAIQKEINRLVMLELTIEHCSGKQAIELVKRNN